MIVFLLGGLVATLGITKIFSVFLGSKKDDVSFGTYVNLFLYLVAVLLPFIYIVGVVALGLGVLFMYSLEFEAKLLARVFASLAAFAVMVGTRVGVFALFDSEGGLVLYVLASLAVFLISSLISDIKTRRARKVEEDRLEFMQKEAEELKTLLISQKQYEIDRVKNKLDAEIKHALVLLDRYKLDELEVLLGRLISKRQ